MYFIVYLFSQQYRMEEYEQCYNVYRDLLKNTTDDFQTERETNLSAVIASLQTWGDGNIVSSNVLSQTSNSQKMSDNW